MNKYGSREGSIWRRIFFVVALDGISLLALGVGYYLEHSMAILPSRKLVRSLFLMPLISANLFFL